ncbi:MAG: hypothetical protein ACJ789_02280 [Thermomicrobiales bacterium]
MVTPRSRRILLLGGFAAALTARMHAGRARAAQPAFSLPIGLPNRTLGDGFFIRHGYACEHTWFNPGCRHTGECSTGNGAADSYFQRRRPRELRRRLTATTSAVGLKKPSTDARFLIPPSLFARERRNWTHYIGKMPVIDTLSWDPADREAYRYGSEEKRDALVARFHGPLPTSPNGEIVAIIVALHPCNPDGAVVPLDGDTPIKRSES